MHSSGFYEVTAKEKLVRARRDQSYKLCTTTLFILFLLLLFIIIGNVLWNKKNYYRYSYSNVDSFTINEPTVQNDYEEHLETTTTTEKQVERILFINNIESTNGEKENKDGLFERYVVNTTESSVNYSTKSIIEEQNNSATSNEKYVQTIPTNENKTETTMSYVSDNTKASTQSSNISIDLQVESATKNENSTEITASYASYDAKASSTMSATQTSNIFTDIGIESNTGNVITSSEIAFTSINSTKLFFSDQNTSDLFSVNNSATKSSSIFDKPVESTTSQVESSTQGAVVNVSEITSRSSTFTDSLLTRESTSKFSSVIDQLIESTSVFNDGFVEENLTTSEVKKTVMNSEPKKAAQICDSSDCKRTAAKMLSYMNHSADPCEDFYEYACGGMQADPQIIDKNFMSRVHERIAKEMLKNDGSKASSLFKKYYESCRRYEDDISMEERVNLAKKALAKIGQFYTSENWSRGNNYEFTETYANLLLNYRALLFDVAPDLDENTSSFYTIRISPVFEKDPFDTEPTITQDPCYLEQQTELQTLTFLNLKTLYDDYKTCKDNNTSFIHSISETLRVLGVFNSSKMVAQHINKTTINVDLEIMERFFSKLPTVNATRKAFFMKQYQSVSLKDLQNTIMLVNWTKLMYSLTSNIVNPETKVQVYFYNELKEGLKSLDNFRQKNPMNFHNAVMALYARSIYQKLVLPKHNNVEQHCFHVATNLLKAEASNLYLSSLSNTEIDHMNRTIDTIFRLLKETLRGKMKVITQLGDTERQASLRKIDQLKLLTPPTISDFIIKDTEESLNLSDNYLDNSMALIKRQRNSIYSIIKAQTDSLPAKQIWTHYATPFQSTAVAVYGLNLVIVPFGVVDYDAVDNFSNATEKNTLDYLTLATIGTLIAHQIFRHFVVTGIHYLDGTRNNQLVTDNFMEYLDFHREMYKEQNITLPWSSQTVSFEIPESTLTERLSETMALRLSHDTLIKGKEKSHSEKRQLLPWLNLNMNQSFYLAYAQMYCTKRLLTHSYVSLYEQVELPSRIRVFVSMSNEKRVGQTWNCRKGSQIVPSSGYPVFPYLEEASDHEEHSFDANYYISV